MSITLAGEYEIEGKDPQGKSYRGVATITECGVFHRIEIHHDGKEMIYGLGKSEGDFLAFALGPKNQVELGVFEIDGNTLHGLWIPPTADGDDLAICGRELSVQSVNGAYIIKEAKSITGECYQGTIRISRAPGTSEDGSEPMQMEWNLDDGTFQALALKTEASIFAVFSFIPDADHGVVVYRIIDEGFQGTWLNSRGEMGSEVLLQK